MAKKQEKTQPVMTIVGGQPNGRRRHTKRVQVPVGVEKLLFLAAQDAEFKKNLMADRQATLDASGIRLRPSEALMLGAISNAGLEAMIDSIVPENPKRRKFMGLVAAAAASLAAGTAELGCEDEKAGCMGITPDIDIDSDSDVILGITPDTDTDSDSGSDSETDSDTSSEDTDVDAGADAGTDRGVDRETVTVEVALNGDGGANPDDDVDGDCNCWTVGAK
ncbi:MAG: hypothetical protein QNJ97_16390 [Myxococcota bacterium]|nr:hypothetical protein [Myxococcota bacterium]